MNFCSINLPRTNCILRNCTGRTLNFVLLYREKKREAVAVHRKKQKLSRSNPGIRYFRRYLQCRSHLSVHFVRYQYVDCLRSAEKLGKLSSKETLLWKECNILNVLQKLNIFCILNIQIYQRYHINWQY